MKKIFSITQFALLGACLILVQSCKDDDEAKEAIGNDAVRNKTLSECLGFLRALQYSPTKKITTTELDQVLAHVGDNFYEVTLNDLDNARNLLSTIYGMDDIKDSL